MFNRFKSKPVVYERDKKVTLVGETDSEGKIFITGYRKEDSTMGQETPKIDIGSARNLTSPFPVEQANTEVSPPVEGSAPNDSVPGAEEEEPVTESTIETPPLDISNLPPVESTESEPTTEVLPPDAPVTPPAEGSATDALPTPPPKPPKPASMGQVSPLFTEEMNQGGRKSRRNKKTGKKQKGGKLRRKSRKQRK
jgi:hypothetical protein